MNQILNQMYDENNKKNKTSTYDDKKKNERRKQLNKNSYGKADIVKVGKVFSIMLILFGIVLVSRSVYAIANSKPKKQDNIQLSTEKMGREVTISITSNLPIKEFSYKWNTGEATKITGDGTVKMSKVVEIPNGNNILNIEIIDYYGNSSTYMKQYIYESQDSGKPTIELSKSGTKLLVTATDDTKMAYLTYSWNDEEATRIDVSDNDLTISTELDVPKGENKLTIVAVDAEQNRQVREETIVGADKPTFTISTDGANIIITAKDDIGIDKITATVDGQTISSGENIKNQKEIVAKIPTTSGNHNITVTVTNTSGLEETKSISVSI